MTAKSARVWQVYATIVRVIDGDSVVCDLDLGWGVWQRNRTVRVAHINAPELHVDGKSNPPGEAAKRTAETLLMVGSVVRFASHSIDKYGRALGVITLDDNRDFAAQMMERGFAVAYEGTKA